MDRSVRAAAGDTVTADFWPGILGLEYHAGPGPIIQPSSGVNLRRGHCYVFNTGGATIYKPRIHYSIKPEMLSSKCLALLLIGASIYVADAWNCQCGTYCPDPVKKFRSPVACPAGSYCPKSKYNATSFPVACPAGKFCPKGSCAPSACPCGSKCPAKSSAPTLCQPPFYCPKQNSSSMTLCPIGYMCDKPGMCEPSKCEPGTFVTCVGKVSCDACPKGRFCPTVTTSTLCPAGFFCPGSSPEPIPCPPNKRCPLGSHKPL